MNLEQKLRASKPATEPPPFLHARIMNSLRAPEVAKRLGVRRFFAALAFVTTIVLLFALVHRAKKPQQIAAHAPIEIDLPSLPSIEVPANNSLQQEMENLKADTRNAARALASSFLPSQP